MLPGVTPFLSGATGPVDIAFVANATALAFNDTFMTFPSVGIGAAAGDRLVYVAISAEADPFDIESVTIAGITATKAVGVRNTAHAPDLVAEIWYALVPSGTTATIIVNFVTTGFGGMAVSTFRVLGVNVPVADSGGDTGNAASVSATVDVPPGGGLIAVALKQGDNIDTNWTGAIKNSEIDAGGYAHTVASTEVPNGQLNRTVTAGSAAVGQRAMCVVAIG